jgi:hypothetical protein
MARSIPTRAIRRSASGVVGHDARIGRDTFLMLDERRREPVHEILRHVVEDA